MISVVVFMIPIRLCFRQGLNMFVDSLRSTLSLISQVSRIPS